MGPRQKRGPQGLRKTQLSTHVQDQVKAGSAGSCSLAPDIVGDQREVPALEQKDSPSGGADSGVHSPRARQVAGSPGSRDRKPGGGRPAAWPGVLA